MFFDRFRAEVRKYADGVHELGAPASPEHLEARPLPDGLRALYQSWDGLRLFLDSIVIEPLARLADAGGGRLRLGEALGAPIELDAAGRVYERDEAGDALLAGTDLERWLSAVTAREGLLLDREGEWKDVFDGDDLMRSVRQKRVRSALKIDPGAAAWQVEAAELAFEDGDDEAAERALRAAVAADPQAGIAWELLGGLERQAGRFAEAEAAFARAAGATVDRERAAVRWAEAARAAGEQGREGERAGYAERARAAEAPVDAWLAEAQQQLDEGHAESAWQVAGLAHAVRPDATSEALVKQLRIRRKLRVT